MTARKIDPATGGIATSGEQFVTGVGEVVQTIRTRLRLHTGEFWRDVTEGTPWFDTVFSKQESLDRKEAVIRSRIARTEGVSQILALELTFENDGERRLGIDAVVLTNLGVVRLQEQGA